MTEQEYTYARFWKCALQVNSHRCSAAFKGGLMQRKEEYGVDY